MRPTATARNGVRGLEPVREADSRLIEVEQRLVARTEELRALRESRGYRSLQFLWRLSRPRALALLGALWAVAAAGALVAGSGPAAAILVVLAIVALSVIAGTRRSGPSSLGTPARRPASRVKELPPSVKSGDTVTSERPPSRRGDGSSSLQRLIVASIFDEMSHACFAPECRLVPLPADEAGWREVLDDVRPDLLLVESAWAGNTGAWQYRIASYPKVDGDGLRHLRRVVQRCRELGIPAVFWNKEDPVHFERFRDAAALFDYVFTTDERCRERYARLAGLTLDRVQALPFAAQPRLHNPIEIVDERSTQPCFAGTFYRDRHPERQAALEALLDGARPFGLVIYDRMLGTSSDAYAFPDRFASHVAGRLDYDEVVRAYKRHRVFLNANSVVASTTMCSRRIFELLACETAVVSTPSRALEPLLGDSVVVARSESQSTAGLRRLTRDEEYRRELVQRGRRRVLTEHHYGRRLEQVCEAVGLPHRLADERDDVAAVIAVEPGAADWEVGDLVEQLARQQAAPTELLLGVTTEGDTYDVLFDRYRTRVVGTTARIVSQRDADLSERHKELAAIASAPWVSPLTVGQRLADNLYVDLRQASRYSQADVIGAGLRPGDRQRYTDTVDPSVAVARRELMVLRGWPAGVNGDDFRPWFREGLRFFAAVGGGAEAGG